MGRASGTTKVLGDSQIPVTPQPKRKRAEKSRVVPAEYDIPYFAHMQLNPARYPVAVGVPVGKPPFESAPYGGHRKKRSTKEDAEDDSEEEDSESSEEEVVPQKRKALAISPPQNGFSGSDYKKAKMAGGRPALAKKVTAEMDSDDELIVQMKQARYQEKDIAQRLIDEGRTHYHPKTIGTRWARLKKVMQARNDELLDADLTDWHDGDDEVLAEAIAKADAEVEKIKQEIDAKKWRMVADKMKFLKPVVNFSQNACRKRHEDLEAGIAKATPESIPDPDDEVKARIRSRLDKEEAIKEAARFTTHHQNLDNNAWTSRMRDY